MNNNYIKSVPLSELTQVDNFVNGNNLHVVQLYKDKNLYKTYVVTTKDLESIETMPFQHAEILLSSSGVLPMMLVKKEYLDNLTKYGSGNHYYLHELEGIDKFDQKPFVSKDFIKDSKNEQYQVVQQVPNSHSKQAWMTADGVVYCEPFVLDYISARISDTYFHLDDFVEKLSQRNDLAFITYTERWAKDPSKVLHCPLQGNEPGIGGVINEIEHHIEENEPWPAEKETVTIVYYPKHEDVQKVLNWDRDIETKKPEVIKRRLFTVERFIVEDILGGNEFLQHPVVDEVEPPKRKFKH